MNWYKLATIHNFEDRNIVNDKISSLSDIAERLLKMSKLVFQTQSGTKTMLQSMLDTKVLTTYPIVQKLLEKAGDVALDSPQKFSAMCLAAASEISMRVSKMKQERADFVNNIGHNERKGWDKND